MKIHRQKPTERGVSLVESMIACVVLSVALLGLCQGVTTALLMDRDSRGTVMALNLVQDQIEDIKNSANTRDTYDLLTGGTANIAADGTVTTDSTKIAYTMTWTVTNGVDAAGNAMLDSSSLPAYKNVTVTVSPATNAYGPTDAVTISTQVARPIL